MNKKGFTLIEVLAVIAILGIVLMIILPKVNTMIDKSEDKTLEIQKENVLAAAKNYFAANPDNNRPVELWQTSKVYLSSIIAAGYLEEVLNPTTEEACDYNTSYIEVGKGEDRNYIYDIYLSCGDYEYTGTDETFAMNNYKIKDGAKDYIGTMPTAGNVAEATYTEIKTAGDISAIYDPVTSNECDGKVIIENIEGDIRYLSGLVCDSYISIDAWNLIEDSDFENSDSWLSTSSTNTIDTSYLTNTTDGTAVYGQVYQNTGITPVAAEIYFAMTRLEVLSESCDSVSLIIDGISVVSASQSFMSQTTPSMDESYSLYGVITLSSDILSDMGLVIKHTYSEAASGNAINVYGTRGGPMLLNLTDIASTTGIDFTSKTSEEMKLIIESSGY